MNRLVVLVCLLAFIAGCPGDGGSDGKRVNVSEFDLTGKQVKGSGPVLIVEYSDFECPFCARAQPGLKKALEQRGDSVSFVFKHYPLDSACNPAITRAFHPFACKTSVASECAGEQGVFWQYHDALFEESLEAQALFRAPDFSDASLIALAGSLGLDKQKFSQCLSNSDYTQIQNDLNEGVRVGVRGTPTFFINGKEYVGALTASDFVKAIDEELELLNSQ